MTETNYGSQYDCLRPVWLGRAHVKEGHPRHQDLKGGKERKLDAGDCRGQYRHKPRQNDKAEGGAGLATSSIHMPYALSLSGSMGLGHEQSQTILMTSNFDGSFPVRHVTFSRCFLAMLVASSISAMVGRRQGLSPTGV